MSAQDKIADQIALEKIRLEVQNGKDPRQSSDPDIKSYYSRLYQIEYQSKQTKKLTPVEEFARIEREFEEKLSPRQLEELKSIEQKHTNRENRLKFLKRIQVNSEHRELLQRLKEKNSPTSLVFEPFEVEEHKILLDYLKKQEIEEEERAKSKKAEDDLWYATQRPIWDKQNEINRREREKRESSIWRKLFGW
jgi:hypothetical protein